MWVSRVPILFLLFHACGASASTPTPDYVAAGFYGWVIKHDGGGLPSESSLNAGEALMSRELVSLLRAASVTEKRCVQSTPPDRKPLIFEGSMFVDHYEGLTKILSMRLKKTGGRILVESRLEYKGRREGSDASTWSDRMMLSREKEKWVVADVAGPSRKNTLVATLKNYIRRDCRP